MGCRETLSFAALLGPEAVTSLREDFDALKLSMLRQWCSCGKFLVHMDPMGFQKSLLYSELLSSYRLINGVVGQLLALVS